MKAEKPVNTYFESDFNVFTEMAQEYLRLALSNNKKSSSHEEEGNEDSKKYIKLMRENETMKKKYNELSKKFEDLIKENEERKKEHTHKITKVRLDTTKDNSPKGDGANSARLTREINELRLQFIETKEAHESAIRALKENEIELNSLKDQIKAINESHDK